MTKEERILYDQAMITKTDIEYGKLYSFNEGKAEGLAEGRAEGLAEGEARANREIARKMLAKEMPVQDIAELTGISVSELKNLCKQ